MQPHKIQPGKYKKHNSMLGETNLLYQTFFLCIKQHNAYKDGSKDNFIMKRIAKTLGSKCPNGISVLGLADLQ